MNKERSLYLKYYLENNVLYAKSYFMGNEVSDVKVGNIENLLFKVKIYDEEYENLLNEIKHMKTISKDYEDLQQRRDKAIEYINNLKVWYEHNYNICSLEDNFKMDLLEILGGKQ